MEREYVEHLYQKEARRTNQKRKEPPHHIHETNTDKPQARAVAEATMFEFTWYGTVKI